VSHLGDSSTAPTSSSSLRGAGGGESGGLGLASSTAAAAAAALDHSAHNMAGELPLSPEDLSSDVRFILYLLLDSSSHFLPFYYFIYFLFMD
jgi:hypothetical protein